ncbi:YcfL family protein [Paraferrimonas haliotis]|uniref:DUF1425 domain-containing protein n=1 Tax=Paraferrimonas haliotis TaxID=2013866 RepID=A0AA37TSJ1_9GAMM|nr:YcfL family protein [Paraferrimonas haliotis]GLS84705.1 hypothetical protein GCM10007894_26820 [Paraferrimonas haliotis]
MKHGLRSLAVVVMAIALGACAAKTGGVSAKSNGDTRIDNSSFGHKVTITNVRSRMQADHLQGSAMLVSKISTDFRVQYRFSWYDKNGFVLENEGQAWKSVKLHGKQQYPVQALAPNANAVDFEVYVREAISY